MQSVRFMPIRVIIGTGFVLPTNLLQKYVKRHDVLDFNMDRCRFQCKKSLPKDNKVSLLFENYDVHNVSHEDFYGMNLNMNQIHDVSDGVNQIGDMKKFVQNHLDSFMNPYEIIDNLNLSGIDPSQKYRDMIDLKRIQGGTNNVFSRWLLSKPKDFTIKDSISVYLNIDHN